MEFMGIVGCGTWGSLSWDVNSFTGDVVNSFMGDENRDTFTGDVVISFTGDENRDSFP